MLGVSAASTRTALPAAQDTAAMVAPLPALAVITALVLDSASGLIMNNPTHKLLRDGDMDKIIASHGLDLSKVMRRKNRGKSAMQNLANLHLIFIAFIRQII